jgi:hypothetical protein
MCDLIAGRIRNRLVEAIGDPGTFPAGEELKKMFLQEFSASVRPFLQDGGHYKRRPLSLLHQFPNPDTEESGDIFNQLIFGFAESVFPVAACSAYKAECFVSGGL